MKKKCVRKHWRLLNPLTYVLEGIQPTNDDKLTRLRVLELSAIEAFRTGKATIYDWQNLTDTLNVAETLGRGGIGPEVLPVCNEASQHLLEAANRYKKTKRMGMTGPGLQALRELHEYHDLQRTSISLIEYEKAIRETRKRIQSKAPEVVEV